VKGHHFGLLVVAAVLAILAALWTTSIREPVISGESAGEFLLPGLADNLNNVTGVKLTGPGAEIIATLTRGEISWVLAEKSGYRANMGELRELLVKLSEATLLEEKTSNPEFYERLGVENIEASDAGGVLVELEGVDVPAVIVGDQEGSRQATYVRLIAETTSWLASGDINVANDTMRWLDRQAIDINASRIAEIEITHADGHTLRVSKSEFGQPNFDVANIPAGRELERDNIANAIGSVLKGLRVDDVAPLSDSGFAGLSTTRAAFRAFDGLVINVDVAAKDDKYYAYFHAATDAAIATRYLPAGASEDEEEGPPPQPQADLTAIAAEADELNGKFSDWVYELPELKYDQLSRRLDDLLKDQS